MNSYKIFFGDVKIVITSENNQQAEEKKIIISVPSLSFPESLISEIKNKSLLNDYVLITDTPKDLFKLFKSRFNVIHAAGGIVRNVGGELLFIYKNKKWDLPKGKIDTGETKKEAALREVSEECGIRKLQIIKKAGKTYHFGSVAGKQFLKKTTWYEMFCTDPRNIVPDSEENITDIEWIDLDKEPYFIDNLYENLQLLLQSWKQNRQIFPT